MHSAVQQAEDHLLAKSGRNGASVLPNARSMYQTRAWRVVIADMMLEHLEWQVGRRAGYSHTVSIKMYG